MFLVNINQHHSTTSTDIRLKTLPVYQFEAMDATGEEIRDEIDAASEEEAQTTIRQMGYFVTKISEKKQAASAQAKSGKKRSFGTRWSKDQAHLRFHATIVDFAGCWSAHSSQLENFREQPKTGQAEKRIDGHVR